MAAITQIRIFEIANALDAAGKPPTLAAVRKALGGGSFTTISEAMTLWKAQKQAKDTPRQEPVPQGVVDHLQEFGSTTWALAMELANARLAAERAALAEARGHWETEKKEAVELADQLNLEVEGLRTAVQEQAEKRTVAEANMRHEAEHNGVLRTENAGLRAEGEQHAARAAEITRRAEDLNAELARVHQHNGELMRLLGESVQSARAPGTGQKTPK